MVRKILKILIVIMAMLLTLVSVYSFNVEVVNTNPSPISAGEYGDITLRFTNPSENIRNNVMIKIKNSDQFYSLSSTDVFLSKSLGKESITKTFRVFFSKDIPEGFINLPISISYDSIKTEVKVPIYIQDKQSNPQIYIGEIVSIPNELLPDTKDNKLTITLQNLGDKDAELVKTELIVDESKIKPSNSFSFVDSVSSIISGGESNFVYTIDVEKGVFGEVPAKLKLRYRAVKSINNSYEIFEKEIDFKIRIADAPFLKIVNVEQLSNFKIGTSENIIRLTLKNEGTESAKEVRVRVTPDSSYPFAYEKLTQYATSKIEVGENITVDFKVEILSNAQAKNYPTTILLESLVGESRYTQEDFMSLNVIGEKQSTNYEKGYLIIGLILFVSIGLGINRIIKRKKRNKK